MGGWLRQREAAWKKIILSEMGEYFPRGELLVDKQSCLVRKSQDQFILVTARLNAKTLSTCSVVSPHHQNLDAAKESNCAPMGK